MKRNGLICLIAAMTIAACAPKQKTIEFPAFEATNTRNLIIEKVVLTDSLTTLYARGYHEPGWWIKITKDIRLIADGQKYEMTGTERIRINEKLKMPSDGDSAFVMKFKPLPLDTKKFDFVEDDHEAASWAITGIDLTGKFASPYKRGLPRNVRCSKEDMTDIPDFVYDIGETTINLHLLGYKPELYDEITFDVKNIIGGYNEYIVKIDPETGIASHTFTLFGTGNVGLISPYRTDMGHFNIAPGENVDIWCDLAFGNIQISRICRNKTPEMDIVPLYTRGSIYDGLNNQPRDYGLLEINMTHVYWTEPEYCSLSADEYTGMIIKEYDQAKAELDKYQSRPILKKGQEAELKLQALNAISFSNRNREMAYRLANGIPYNIEYDSKLDKIGDEHIRRVIDHVAITDPFLMFSYHADALEHLELDVEKDRKYGVIRYLQPARIAAAEAYNGKLSDERIEEMKKWDAPYFAKACEYIQQQTLLKIKEGQNLIAPTPEVPINELFDAIIAPHKGKVVLVDFWNTWCSPCRAAIKENEPLKTGELTHEDLVWIYIANETSPVDKYLEMIPGIKGIHYRLTPEQWKQLTSEDFKIDGIPSYVLVKKDGTYALTNEFRKHKTLVKRLKEELNR